MARQKVSEFWRGLERAVLDARREAVTAGATLLYTGTLKELQQGSPGSGRAYKRGKRRVHRASVAGAAPARDRGVLMRAIGMQVLNGRNPTALVGVKRTAPYGKYLDPADGEAEPRIGRRPFLSKARRVLEPDIRQTMADVLERRLRRLG